MRRLILERTMGWCGAARERYASYDGRIFQLLLLTIVTVSAFYARTSLGPLQESMRVALSMSDNQMALLQGPPLALGIMAGIPFGVLIDRLSRVRLILMFLIIGILATGLTAWAPDFSLIFAARCLIGLSASSMYIAVLSLLADWYPPKQRGQVMTVVSFGAVAGMSAAFGLGGILIAATGSMPNGWRWAMLGQALPLLVALLALVAMREPPRSGSREKTGGLRQAYLELWCYRSVALPLLLASALLAGLADGAALTWAAPVLSRSYGLSPERVGAIMALALFFTGLGGPVLGGAIADLGQRTGGPYRTVVLMTGLLILGIPGALFPVAPGTGSAVVLLTVFLTLGAAFQVALAAVSTIVIPPELRGSFLALMMAVGSLFGFALAPLIVSHLSTATGGESTIDKALALVCVTFSVLSVVVFWIGRKQFLEPAIARTQVLHSQKRAEARQRALVS